MSLLHPCEIIFEACLQRAKMELELLCNPEKFPFVQNSIRRGVSVVSHRRATANNEFVLDYNLDDPTSWILFVDANNLYGHAMSQPLPTRDFKFLSPKEIEEFDISKTAISVSNRNRGI